MIPCRDLGRQDVRLALLAEISVRYIPATVVGEVDSVSNIRGHYKTLLEVKQTRCEAVNPCSDMGVGSDILLTLAGLFFCHLTVKQTGRFSCKLLKGQEAVGINNAYRTA